MSYSTVGLNLSFSAGAGVTDVDVTNSIIANNATFIVASGASVTIDPSQVGGQLAVHS